MPPLLNAQGLVKAYGAVPLLRDISFTISEGERIGLIGPNGSGKSTLLEILSGRRQPDRGSVALRRATGLGYVAQESRYEPGDTVRRVIERALAVASRPDSERGDAGVETLGRAGFEDFDVEALHLSGGWQKRLAIVEALVPSPDILLLDEPTNHLDLAGIEWLERLLREAPFACVVVSHDRYFLENVCSGIVELDRIYPEGVLRVAGSYTNFLEKKTDFLGAQSRRQESLENRVRIELDWLRRGPKARTGKSKARIDRAHEMIDRLADLNSRTRTSGAEIMFSATDRRTKRLIELEDVACAIGGRTLFDGLDFVITAGMRVGLVGPNGSGKTTLLRVLDGAFATDEDTASSRLSVQGAVRRADGLRIVYFDQARRLDPDETLRRALGPEGDSVVYQGRLIHVASWAARFLFSSEQLNQPVGRLSGGERARVLIARLMLEPADVLLLDEPTNDLDIPTLEVLEESLLEFRGALVLVTHDRYLLDRVSTLVLGLDGRGAVERFADYRQWEEWEAGRRQLKGRSGQGGVVPTKAARVGPAPDKELPETPPPGRKRLSYLEAREFDGIEARIQQAEEVLDAKRAAFEDPAIASNGERLLDAQRELEAAQTAVDLLYRRWSELEEKKR